MPKNNGKILYFSSPRNKKIRRIKNTWNYYQSLFFFSLAVNLMLAALLYSYTFNN